MLERACGLSKSTVYKRVVDETTTAFFIDYWTIAARDYPALRMKREKDRPAKSKWVRLHPDVGLPGHIEVWHKAAETFAADLQFSRTRVEDLHAAVGHLIEPDMALEQRHKSAVVRIATTPLSVVKGCGSGA